VLLSAVDGCEQPSQLVAFDVFPRQQLVRDPVHDIRICYQVLGR
jgi:hypothetical protein